MKRLSQILSTVKPGYSITLKKNTDEEKLYCSIYYIPCRFCFVWNFLKQIAPSQSKSNISYDPRLFNLSDESKYNRLAHVSQWTQWLKIYSRTIMLEELKKKKKKSVYLINNGQRNSSGKKEKRHYKICQVYPIPRWMCYDWENRTAIVHKHHKLQNGDASRSLG